MILLTKSSISAALGISNIFFWHEYGNYFGGNTAEAPLLHTWSLGVEEQFYVIWPLFVVALVKLRLPYMMIGLVILTTIAGIISETTVRFVASASYYLLPSRFFELMIGGVLALFSAYRNSRSRPYAKSLFSLGLTTIALSLFGLNKTSSFPGINAIWPCVGTALIIWSGGERNSCTKILTIRPMVFIGVISYSLYLWHWPIISYLNYLNITINSTIGICVILASILLAWLSWKFIEKPLRQTGGFLKFPTVLIERFAIPLGVLICIQLTTSYMSGFPDRFDSRAATLEQSLKALPDIMRRGCHVPSALYGTPPNFTRCRLGANKQKPDDILIGDSYANHFTGMLDVMAKKQNLSFMDYTMDGCPPILGYEIENSPLYQQRCLKRNKNAYDEILKQHFPRVVLASNWPKNNEAGEKLISYIATILESGAQLTLILNNETIPHASSCPIRRIMYKTTNGCTSTQENRPEYLNKIQHLYPKVNIIDPNIVICDRGTCSPTIGDTLLYRDDGHLNDVGSRLIGEILMKNGINL